MYLILADDPWEDLALEDLTSLPDQLPHTHRDVTSEDLVTGLGAPDKLVLDVVHGVTAVAILPSSSTVVGCGGLLDAVCNGGDEICPPEGGGLNLTHGQSTAGAAQPVYS
jgi:hypothetical protein